MSEKNYIASPDYFTDSLCDQQFSDDPNNVFSAWYQAATESTEVLPNGMVLSTVDQHHCPQSRVVLMKYFSADELCFFSNYQSHKGLQLESNPNVSLVFWWKNLYRQVRLCGQAKKMTQAQSEDYFMTRDRQSQIGAIVSPQSCEIASRDALESKIQAYEKTHADETLCCPKHWGGYSVKINRFEFWQAGNHRLHDRIEYQLQNDRWLKRRLAP